MLLTDDQAITEMARQLRAGKGKTGVILANGGVATYQNVVCLSTSPRSDGLPYPDHNPLPEYVTDVQVPTIDERAQGDATIEVWCKFAVSIIKANSVQTYSVEFNRDGSPLRGYVVGRLNSNGHRFLANHADQQTLLQLASWDVEPIGRSGHVEAGSDGRNLFSFGRVESARL